MLGAGRFNRSYMIVPNIQDATRKSNNNTVAALVIAEFLR